MFKKIFLSTATVLVATSLGVGAVHADDADTQSLSGSSSKTTESHSSSNTASSSSTKEATPTTSQASSTKETNEASSSSQPNTSSKTLPQAGSNDGVIFLASGAALAGLLVGGYVLKKKVVQTNA